MEGNILETVTTGGSGVRRRVETSGSIVVSLTMSCGSPKIPPLCIGASSDAEEPK